MAFSIVWAIPGSGRQIKSKASEPAPFGVRAQPKWPRSIIATPFLRTTCNAAATGTGDRPIFCVRLSNSRKRFRIS